MHVYICICHERKAEGARERERGRERERERGREREREEEREEERERKREGNTERVSHVKASVESKALGLVACGGGGVIPASRFRLLGFGVKLGLGSSASKVVCGV